MAMNPLGGQSPINLLLSEVALFQTDAARLEVLRLAAKASQENLPNDISSSQLRSKFSQGHLLVRA